MCVCVFYNECVRSERSGDRASSMLTGTVNAERWAVHSPAFLLTPSGWSSCTQAAYNLAKMAPQAQPLSPRQPPMEGTDRGRKRRYESQFMPASYWAASRLTGSTPLPRPRAWLPLAARTRASLMMAGGSALFPRCSKLQLM